MTSLAVIEKGMSSIEKYLKILERYKKLSLDEIKNDIDKRGALERYLYLAVQATLDLAEAIIAYKNLRRPSTFAESFEILEENRILERDLAQKMVKMAKFRNLITHDYENINYNQIIDVLRNDLDDVEEFLTQAKKILNI